MSWRIRWEEIDFDRRARKRTQQLDAKHEKGKKTRVSPLLAYAVVLTQYEA